MRVFILLLIALYFHSCQAQDRRVHTIDVNLDKGALKKKGAIFGIARVLAVDDNIAIGQIGTVDIVLFDMRSGKLIKSIDTGVVIKILEEQIDRLMGHHYYVPNKEENRRSKYVGVLPYDFRGLLFFKEHGKFVTNMVTTVFNRNDESDQLLFRSLILFDKHLDNIEIIPLDPMNRSTSTDWSNGGFFLGRDRMFTKMMAWKHDHDFDFLEYSLTDEKLYTLSDTLNNIKTSTIGYINRFHSCFSFKDKNYLNLGSMLYTFEGEKIREGHLLEFPHKLERNFLYIEPFDENHLVAYAINNYRTDPNPTGWLLLLDKEFAIIRVIDRFDLRQVVFCSLFTYGKSVYVAGFNEKNESYFIRKYEDLGISP